MTTKELFLQIDQSKFMGNIPTRDENLLNQSGQYTDMMKETLALAGVDRYTLRDTCYDPDYQGIIFLLITDGFNGREKLLEEICSNVWGYGDDSFNLIKFAPGYYLIDICQ